MRSIVISNDKCIYKYINHSEVGVMGPPNIATENRKPTRWPPAAPPGHLYFLGGDPAKAPGLYSWSLGQGEAKMLLSSMKEDMQAPQPCFSWIFPGFHGGFEWM